MCVVFLIVACIFYGAIQIAGNDKEYRDAALSYSMKAYLYNSWVDTYNTIVGIGNVASQYGIGGTSYKDVAEPLAEMRRLEAEMAPLEAIIKPVVDRQNTYSWFSIGAAILSGICLLFCIVIGIMQRKKYDKYIMHHLRMIRTKANQLSRQRPKVKFLFILMRGRDYKEGDDLLMRKKTFSCF